MTLSRSPIGMRLAVTLLKAGVAIVLIGLLCWHIDVQEVSDALAQARLLPLAGALGVSILGVVLSAEKWRGLLRAAGVHLSLAVCARLYWIGMFVSNFLPSSVGGDALRLVLTPAPNRRTDVAGTILVERLTGFAVMLALCGLGLALRPSSFAEPGLRLALLALVVGLGLAVVAALVVPGWLAALLPRLAPRLPRLLRRPVEVAAQVATAVAGLAQDPAVLGRALLLSIVFYGTIILAQYGVLHAVGAQVALADVVLVGAVVPLLTLLPVSLNGLGLAEGAFVLLYAPLGAPPALALAAAVLRRLVDLTNSALGGLLWLGQGSPEAAQDERSGLGGQGAPARGA
ncbi:MAG: lysylphosphatidylglycerol synthase transmembrane domain-containing protein [Geminicoccaceae bacterium]